MIDVNLKGSIYAIKAVLPYMKKNNDGYIININSTDGIAAKPQHSVYSATKYGLRGFNDAMTAALKETNIKIVGFYPGGMKTKLFDNAGVKINLDEVWMDPDKVADVISFVLKQDDSMILDHIVCRRRKQSKE